MEKEMFFIETPVGIQEQVSAVELSDLQLIFVGGGCGETVVG